MKRFFYIIIIIALSNTISCNKTKSVFPDKNFEKAVREALNIKSGEMDLLKLSYVTEISGINCKNLSGIEYLENLENASFLDSDFENIHLISKLKKLKCLRISNSKLTDISFIEELKSLEYLYLSDTISLTYRQ